MPRGRCRTLRPRHEGHDEAAKEPFYSKNFARLLEHASTGARIPSLS
jgi:hypothetical protein